MKKILSIFAVCGALFLTAGCQEKGAQNGDVVVINFVGTLNGTEFPGGSANGYPLELGSGKFVPGFEEQLVGAKKGEARDVKITFPQQYVPGLAGKEVVFKVTVVDIVKKK